MTYYVSSGTLNVTKPKPVLCVVQLGTVGCFRVSPVPRACHQANGEKEESGHSEPFESLVTVFEVCIS